MARDIPSANILSHSVLRQTMAARKQSIN
jgi:hypothetical protein